MQFNSNLSRRDLFLSAMAAGAVAVVPKMAWAKGQDAPKQTPVIVRKSSIGEFEAYTFQDALVSMPAEQAPFTKKVDRKEVSELLTKNHLRQVVSLDFNLMVLRKGREVTMIDAGYGPAGNGRVLDGLAAIGSSIDDVKTIIVTHAHGDHVGGLLDRDDKPLFPKAEVIISEAEHHFWTNSHPDLSKSELDDASKSGAIAVAQKAIKGVGDALTVAPYGKEVKPGFVLEAAPGHTPGHTMVRIASGKEQALHMADTAHHWVLLVQRADWNYVFDADSVLASANRLKTLDMIRADNLRAFGTHMPLPGFGRVEKVGGKNHWVIEPFNY